MTFKQFIQKLTFTAKENEFQIMLFSTDKKNICFSKIGNRNVLVQAFAAALDEDPELIKIIADTIDLLDKKPPKKHMTEDEYVDHLIDIHLNNKELNNGTEGL